MAGFGGLIECENGDWLAVFEVPAHLRAPSLYRYALRLLNEAKERGVGRIIATCDPEISRSETFMRRLGFVQTDQTFNDMAVWECRDLK